MAKRGQGEGTISKRPDGTWWARITVGRTPDGKQKRKAFYGKTRKEVQEKLTAALNDVNTGTYIEPSKMTVAQWMDTWLMEYKKKSVKSSTYLILYKTSHLHILPLIGECKLKDLRNDMVQKLINELSDKGLASSYVTRIYLTLHGALKQATDNGLISRNVAENVKLPTIEYGKARSLSIDEQERFIKTAKNMYGCEIFLMALGTGLRRGELLALTWDDIDFEIPCVYVNKTQGLIKDPDNPSSKWTNIVGTPKTRASERSVPLLPDLVNLLKEIKAKQEAYKPKEITVLKLAHIKKGYTIDEISRIVGIQPRRYHAYINNYRLPEIHLLQYICEKLDVKLNDVVDWDEQRIQEGLDDRRQIIRVPLKKVINEEYQDNNLIFCTQYGTPYCASNINKRFQVLKQKAGIEDIHIHCLRHTFATRGLESGIEMKVMQELLGHASMKMTADLYTHVLPEKKSSSVMKLENYIKL